jgi:hypothetical protein
MLLLLQELTTFMPAYNPRSSKKSAVNVLDLPMFLLARCVRIQRTPQCLLLFCTVRSYS